MDGSSTPMLRVFSLDKGFSILPVVDVIWSGPRSAILCRDLGLRFQRALDNSVELNSYLNWTTRFGVVFVVDLMQTVMGWGVFGEQAKKYLHGVGIIILAKGWANPHHILFIFSSDGWVC